MSVFGDRLRARRMEMKISQVELAEKLGVKSASVSFWESGRNSPSAENISAIADILDCSADYLLGRTNRPELSQKTVQTEQGPAIVDYDAHRLTDEDKLREIVNEMIQKALRQRSPD
jgi:transcriptional regulator with XRE-family HTH domain